MRAAGCAAASAARDGRPSRPSAARRSRCPLHTRARSAVSSRQRAPLAARSIALAAAAGVQPNDEDGAEDSDAERLGADFRRMQRLAAQADDADALTNLAPPPAAGPSAAPGYGVPAAAAVPSRGLDRLLQAARERKKQQSGTAVMDTAAAPPSNRVPWRSRLSAANAAFPESPERQHWLLQLMLTAKGADGERSRQLLADMSLDGYPPGPREFHIAVATHALAGDAVGALRVMQDQHARGGRALFETYKAIIRVAAGQGMPDVAVEAQEAATRAGYDDQTSWRLLVICLMTADHWVPGFRMMKAGMARGYRACSDIALQALRFTAEIKDPEGAMHWVMYCEENKLEMTSAHDTYAIEASLWYPLQHRLVDGENSPLGAVRQLMPEQIWIGFAARTTHGLNMLLEIFVRHYETTADNEQLAGDDDEDNIYGEPPAVTLLYEMEFFLDGTGHKPDALTHVLFIRLACLFDEFDVAMFHFDALAKTPQVVGTTGVFLLSLQDIASLLSIAYTLGDGDCVLRVLSACAQDGMKLAPGGMLGPGLRHCTPVSRWFEPEEYDFPDSARVTHHGFLQAWCDLDLGSLLNEATGPFYAWMPPSQMSTSSLRREAQYLGIPYAGTHEQLVDSITAAREAFRQGETPPRMLERARDLYEADPPYTFDLRVDSGPERDQVVRALRIAEAMVTFGAYPTQGDLLAMSLRVIADLDDDVTPGALLKLAKTAPEGACVQLYALAAQVHLRDAENADRESALLIFDEADLAGHNIPAELVRDLMRFPEEPPTAIAAFNRLISDTELLRSRVPVDAATLERIAQARLHCKQEPSGYEDVTPAEAALLEKVFKVDGKMFAFPEGAASMLVDVLASVGLVAEDEESYGEGDEGSNGEGREATARPSASDSDLV